MESTCFENKVNNGTIIPSMKVKTKREDTRIERKPRNSFR